MNTDVIGNFSSFEKARSAAEGYVVDSSLYELEEEESDEGDETDESGESEKWRKELSGINWYTEGFYREEQCDDNIPDDRVHIKKRSFD